MSAHNVKLCIMSAMHVARIVLSCTSLSLERIAEYIENRVMLSLVDRLTCVHNNG